MNRIRTILVCDDEQSYLELYSELLGTAGFEVVTTRSGEECLESARSRRPDLVLLDVKLPGMGGHEVCARLRQDELTQTLPVIFVTATYHDVHDRVSGLEAGADDYLTKPFFAEELQARVQGLLRVRDLQERLVREERSKAFLQEEVQALQAQLAGVTSTWGIIGRNPRIQKIVSLLESIKDTAAGVLILGETGTGKGMIAQALHLSSSRRNGPFVKVDCSSLSDTLLESELFGHEKGAFTGAVKLRQGRFERADGGTIFLDEIGEMPLDLQAKLLRAVQDMEFERVGGDETLKVDVRVIAATNVNLPMAVEGRTFRKDLFYRLNVIRIDLPPLRERSDDLPLLAGHFLERYARKNQKDVTGIDEKAMRLLLTHSWPGNVRELENVIERAVVLTPGRTITPDLVVLQGRESTPSAGNTADRPLKDVIDEVEKGILLATLDRTQRSIDRTAQVLGLHRSTLYSKLKKHGISY